MATGRKESLATEIIEQLKTDKQRFQRALLLSLIVNVIQAVVIFLK